MKVDAAYRGDNLIFVVGCPRSGTTWLQRMLAAHPLIRTGQESHLFNFYIGPQLKIWKKVLDPAVTGRGGVGMGCYITEDEFLAAVRDYMVALLGPILEDVEAGELFLEKSPSHALYLDEILELLPNARFIHIIRDPADVVASLLAAGESWGAGWAPRGTRKAAAMWAKHIRAVNESAARIPAGQFFELRYEDLHESPELELARIAKFLEVEWSPAEVRLAVEANTAGRAKVGDGTGIPVGGAFATSGGVVVEPAGFVRDGRPGSGRRDLSWWQKILVRRYTRGVARKTPQIGPDLHS